MHRVGRSRLLDEAARQAFMADLTYTPRDLVESRLPRGLMLGDARGNWLAKRSATAAPMPTRSRPWTGRRAFCGCWAAEVATAPEPRSPAPLPCRGCALPHESRRDRGGSLTAPMAFAGSGRWSRGRSGVRSRAGSDRCQEHTPRDWTPAGPGLLRDACGCAAARTPASGTGLLRSRVASRPKRIGSDSANRQDLDCSGRPQDSCASHRQSNQGLEKSSTGFLRRY